MRQNAVLCGNGLKQNVCQSHAPPCHIVTGSGTVHYVISKELIGKY